MLWPVLPLGVCNLYGVYAGELEELATFALGVEAPHLNVVCGKCEGLNETVTYRTAV